MFYYLVLCVGCAELSRWDGGSPAPVGAGMFTGSGRDSRSGDFRSSRARAHFLQGSCRHAAATGEVIWSVLCYINVQLVIQRFCYIMSKYY